jgi:hypothetical protein
LLFDLFVFEVNELNIRYHDNLKESPMRSSSGFFYLTLAIASSAMGLFPAFAEEQDQYAGIEYNPTSFRDDSFDKQTFTEIGTKPKAVVKKFMIEPPEPVTRPKRGEASVHEEPEGAGERAAFQKEEEFTPIHELTGDWVPGKIDLTSNGGFSIEPFNGSPVPYDLNGHVDPQRGKP